MVYTVLAKQEMAKAWPPNTASVRRSPLWSKSALVDDKLMTGAARRSGGGVTWYMKQGTYLKRSDRLQPCDEFAAPGGVGWRNSVVPKLLQTYMIHVNYLFLIDYITMVT